MGTIRVTDERLFKAAEHAFGPYHYVFRGWYHIFSNMELTEQEKNTFEEEAKAAEEPLIEEIVREVDREILREMKKTHPEFFLPNSLSSLV